MRWLAHWRRRKRICLQQNILLFGAFVIFVVTWLIFSDESQAITLSGIENFFLQGKAAQLNRARGGRRKGRSLPHQADANLVEEDEEDDEDGSVDSSEKFAHCDLGGLRDYFNSDEVRLQKQEEIEEHRKDFPWWTYCLAGGFNVLLYGVGSKKALLDAFRENQLSPYRTLTVDGFREDVTARTILINIIESMQLKNCEQRRRSLVDWAKHIASAIERKKQQLIILLNNIDSPNLRDSADQEVLATLVENPAVLMIATIDHINATLLWTSVLLESFKWVYCRADTYTYPADELLAGQSSLLGLNPKTSHSAHSLSSLDVLWQSLATNSRSIFRLFYAMFFSANEPVSFWDLFSAAKDDFLVSSDTALRQQLVEFNDHRVLRWKRGDDGNEQLVGTLDRCLIEKFLNEKGLNLEYV
ncbi:origin recognition complex subunit 2 [Oesophagostomum dentatum]|uniref:Origin recognition complex subunit 2 n=1 Tax=Oesophagostomum dentatum TaxID=61180 RepID=A0A0B1T8T5_OESDE|nr:origin recognition complex subunit 2 [Oesophagostomum dentatum]